LAFVVLAAFAVPNAWSLTQEQDYVLEGSTLYIPLRICEPRSISFGVNTTVHFFEDPQAISVDTNSTANETAVNTTADKEVNNDDDLPCHTLDNLINACVLSIIFAMTATLIFFVFDAMAYYKKVRAGVPMGMALFLVFILVMASASCYAMYQEMTYWQEHFEKLFHDLEPNDYGVEEVQPHGNKSFIAWTFVLALIAAGAVLVDTLVIFCCGENIKPAVKPPRPPAPPSEQALPPANAPAADASAETTPPLSEEEEPGSAGGKPAWTNV
jgi:ABC-type glycerol-3-phosphate transport system permease component